LHQPLGDTTGAYRERLRAQILLQRGVALRILQRPNESVAALQQALQIFSKADSLSEVSVTHSELARSLAAVSDWRGAYEHQVQFQNANDLLLQRLLDQRFATLRVEYDLGAKEQENLLLQRENEATERALAQERRATRLQATVLALTVLLAAVAGGRAAVEGMKHLAELQVYDLQSLHRRLPA